ncbi:unnamed protein product [Moneuplotes crassus]|uniref:EF-hand domain-containing protein n=1 Tax=Euplotes crassus TaxID=5936 RepID=A0AAD1U3P0_EUPCR|nr:unnamed protein product [Moneuplotes crassus]
MDLISESEKTVISKAFRIINKRDNHKAQSEKCHFSMNQTMKPGSIKIFKKSNKKRRKIAHRRKKSRVPLTDNESTKTRNKMMEATQARSHSSFCFKFNSNNKMNLISEDSKKRLKEIIKEKSIRSYRSNCHSLNKPLNRSMINKMSVTQPPLQDFEEEKSHSKHLEVDDIQDLFKQCVRKDDTKQSWHSIGTNNSHSQLLMYKNRVNDFFMQSMSLYGDALSKDKIFNYTRGNKIGLAHMQELKRILLSLNSEGNDKIDFRDFLLRLREKNFVFPESFLVNLIKDIQINPTTLSYQKFVIVLNIFYSLPIFKKGDSNNSDSFKNSQDQYGFKKIDLPDHLVSLMKLIHVKIDEKFKDYKDAFRAFDNDYSGNIGFTELVEGLETMGILLELESMKKLFNYLDVNKDGEINFNEFCRLHYDSHLMNKDPPDLKYKVKPLVAFDHITKSTKSAHKPPLHRPNSSVSNPTALQTQSFNFKRIRRVRSRKKQPRQKFLGESQSIHKMVHGTRKNNSCHDMKKIIGNSYYKRKIKIIKKKDKKHQRRTSSFFQRTPTKCTLTENQRYGNQ